MKDLIIKITCTSVDDYQRKEMDLGKYKFGSITTEEPICYSEELIGKRLWYIANKAHEHAKAFGKKFETKTYLSEGIKYLVITRTT